MSVKKTGLFCLPEKKLKEIYYLMLRTRILEERLIRMCKQADGFFWIGGPGEEAFNIPLGLQVRRGEGLDYDFLHLHYRSAGILVAMGLDPRDAMRQMKSTALDPFSGGRNFANHFAVKAWNVVPVSSTIETQYATAIGGGIAHRRHGGQGITIVNGGDAGTAEGEFASCLIWSSRPGNELPILMVVTHNAWGISTASTGQHGEKQISDRAKAFGIRSRTVNGNSVEESYFAIQEAMAYVRQERRPYLLEARVSRLYGHSSATGCHFVQEEEDCLAVFEGQLERAGIFNAQEMSTLREQMGEEMLQWSQAVKQEPQPDPGTVYDFVYFGQKGREAALWRP